MSLDYVEVLAIRSALATQKARLLDNRQFHSEKSHSEMVKIANRRIGEIDVIVGKLARENGSISQDADGFVRAFEEAVSQELNLIELRRDQLSV